MRPCFVYIMMRCICGGKVKVETRDRDGVAFVAFDEVDL